jgi:hypothetical protein
MIKDYSFIWQPTVKEQVAKARQEFNRITPDIITIQAKVMFVGMGLFETKVSFLRVTAESDTTLELGMEETRTVMIPISLMKRMGIIKRANGSKTVTDWLNTPEGQTWLGFFMMKKERS